MNGVKRVRYSSHNDPRYVRLLASSRRWKLRHRNDLEYKRKKAAQDRNYYLRSRDTDGWREQRQKTIRKYNAKLKVQRLAAKRVRHYLRKHPERVTAYDKVRTALRNGTLVRPSTCSECQHKIQPRRDGRSRIQAHHEDYSKPLAVIWLCAYCHGKRRRVI